MINSQFGSTDSKEKIATKLAKTKSVIYAQFSSLRLGVLVARLYYHRMAKICFKRVKNIRAPDPLTLRGFFNKFIFFDPFKYTAGIFTLGKVNAPDPP